MTARLALTASLAFALCACAPKGPDSAQLIASAKALDAKFAAAFNSGNVDAVMDTYENSPELVSFPPDAMEAVGYAAVKAGYAKSFAGMPGAKLEITDAHYRVVGEAVIGYGQWKMVLPGANGSAQVEMTGRFTDVKAERNGKWVYLVDHASIPFSMPDAPPPPPAPPPQPAESAPPPDKG